MSAPLEGAALFDAAQVAMGNPVTPPLHTDAKWLWSSVPAMLEWLVKNGEWQANSNASKVEVSWDPDRMFRQGTIAHGPDLPTALARLVLRVAEMEGKA